MTVLAIIAKKRDGLALDAEEIRFLVSAYVEGTIPDYQMSAWLMAVYLRGMDARETAALTQVMLDSGERIDLADISGRKIDKHSTGGVGDKVSLILAPLMAAAGVKVPMISGRSLGHTGGTLDKLESIPGFKTELTPAAFHDQVRNLGVAMIGQNERLVPADKRIYALRDSTATVASIPLITASILSKKLAEGIDGLVMDIKCGRGAFMTEISRAEALAQSIIHTAALHSLPTVAVITDMNQPLGYAAGNWLEVREVLQALQGRGPEDLMQVTYALGVQMLLLAGFEGSTREAVNLLQRTISSGRAMTRFQQLVRAQGGDVQSLQEPGSCAAARIQQHLRASRSGFVTGIDALTIGEAVVRLGGGRKALGDQIDPAVGVLLGKKTGDQVDKGEILAVIHANQTSAAREALEMVRSAFTIEAAPAPKGKSILRIIKG
ncbi:MAG TPA: thymidine phosphorylase [bacterium]|nr:thymidine phosphorylase [bacterium]